MTRRLILHLDDLGLCDGANRAFLDLSARGAITFIYPQMMNEFLGTKFKIVTGYPGGNQINLAMERGEVEARNNTWSSWKATKPHWLKEQKLFVIAQAGPRARDLDAPSIEDLARSPEDRQLMELAVSGTQFGRPFATNAAPALRCSSSMPRKISTSGRKATSATSRTFSRCRRKWPGAWPGTEKAASVVASSSGSRDSRFMADLSKG